LTLTGTVSATLPFAVIQASAFNVPPAGSTNVLVSFNPTNAGSFSNVVLFASNGGNATNTVIGSGLTPAQLSVGPATLDFSFVAVGGSAQASFTVTNAGGVT